MHPRARSNFLALPKPGRAAAHDLRKGGGPLGRGCGGVKRTQYVAPPILNRYMYSQSCLPLHKTGTMAILRWPSVRGSRVAALLARNKIR